MKSLINEENRSNSDQEENNRNSKEWVSTLIIHVCDDEGSKETPNLTQSWT